MHISPFPSKKHKVIDTLYHKLLFISQHNSVNTKPKLKLFLKAAEIGAVEVEPPSLEEKSLSALKDYFRDDIRQLKQLTHLDLWQWRDYGV